MQLFSNSIIVLHLCTLTTITVSYHLVDVDEIYGYFSPLWPYRYDCTGSEDTLQSGPYSYYSGCDTWFYDLAGVRCTNTSGMLKHLLVPSQSHCTLSYPQGAHVLMARCNWLEGKQVMKEYWSIAIKDSGHFFAIWEIK